MQHTSDKNIVWCNSFQTHSLWAGPLQVIFNESTATETIGSSAARPSCQPIELTVEATGWLQWRKGQTWRWDSEAVTQRRWGELVLSVTPSRRATLQASGRSQALWPLLCFIFLPMSLLLHPFLSFPLICCFSSSYALLFCCLFHVFFCTFFSSFGFFHSRFLSILLISFLFPLFSFPCVILFLPSSFFYPPFPASPCMSFPFHSSPFNSSFHHFLFIIIMLISILLIPFFPSFCFTCVLFFLFSLLSTPSLPSPSHPQYNIQ